MAPRLIDANELLKNAFEVDANDYWNDVVEVEDINNAPTIDAEPKVNASWIDKFGDGNWHCSACDAVLETDEQCRHVWKRCYNCGAFMVGQNTTVV